MQIILSHFGDVSLVNQGKKTNAGIIEQYTGVDGYNGHEKQITEIFNHIYQRTYSEMKSRLKLDEYDDTDAGSSNIVHFLELFESDDPKWIAEIKKYLEN